MKSHLLIFATVVLSGAITFAVDTVTIESAEKACSTGDMEGCGYLSKFELEAGNIASAKDHAKKACEGGAMRGCTVLGLLVEKSDASEAKELFRKACDANYLRGCLNLAIVQYKKGDKKDARKFAKKTCDGGEPIGCTYLGILENELGNKDEAKVLLKKSCDTGEQAGCSNLGVLENAAGNKAEAERLWEKACDEGEQSACQYFEKALNERARLYEHACDQADMSACYNYGLVRERRKDGEPFVMQVYQKACDGGEDRACDAIKNYLTKSCIERKLNADRDCYTSGPKQQLSAGTAIIPKVRVHSESCDKRARDAEKGLGCARVGDFEAKLGNLQEAAKIYKDGCSSGKNNEGCGGLVCIGYVKMSEGKEAEAKRLFKTACDNSQTQPGTYDGAAYKGCTALPTPPVGHYDKKNYAEMVRKAIKDMPKDCSSEWQKAWGPSKKN